MKSLIYQFSYIILIFVLVVSCKKEVSKKITNTSLRSENIIKYAKGFDIVISKNEKKLFNIFILKSYILYKVY